MNGVVYIFEVPKLHCVKIGFSSSYSGVENRLRTTQVYLPTDVRLLVQFPGSVAGERWLHKKFGKVHIRGEWFVRCPEVLKAAKLLNDLAESDSPMSVCEWKSVFKSMKVGAKRWNPHRWQRRFEQPIDRKKAR